MARTMARNFARGIGAALLSFLGAAGAAPEAPPPTLLFSESAHETRADRLRGVFDVRVRLPRAGKGPVRFRMGPLDLEVPGSGRTVLREEARTITATAERSGGGLSLRIRGSIRDWEGGVFSGEFLGYEPYDAREIRRAEVTAGGSTRVFALGLSVRVRPWTWDWETFGVDAAAVGLPIPAEGEAFPPVVRIHPDARSRRWKGRAAGIALARAGEAALSASLDGRGFRGFPPAGTLESDIDGTPVRMSWFDRSIPAPEGSHAWTVRAADGAGRAARDRLRFEAPRPARPLKLDPYLQILEIREDGRVWAWGANDFGEVGDGTKLEPYGPAPLPGPERTRSVAAGFGFSLAVDGRGDAWFWGNLLDPTPRDAEGVRLGNSWPQRLDGIPPVRAAAAGGWDHAVLLMEDGTVRAFGWNGYGNLGDGTTKDRSRPVRVHGLDRIVAMDVMFERSVALRADGTVWTWGGVDPEDAEDPRVPYRVEGLPPCAAVTWSLALDREGGVWDLWGGMPAEAEDEDVPPWSRAHPVRVEGLPPIRAVASSDFHNLALDFEGRIWAWGGNESGEIGDGTAEYRPVPVPGPDLEGVESIAAAPWGSFAVLEDGSLWGWGDVDGVGTIGDYGSPPVLLQRDPVPGHYPLEVGTFDLRARTGPPSPRPRPPSCSSPPSPRSSPPPGAGPRRSGRASWSRSPRPR
jgi:hypothetical protein